MRDCPFLCIQPSTALGALPCHPLSGDGCSSHKQSANIVQCLPPRQPRHVTDDEVGAEVDGVE